MSTHTISFFECCDRDSLLGYARTIEACGAEIVDYKVSYLSSQVKFYIHLNPLNNVSLSSFIDKLRKTSVWNLTSWYYEIEYNKSFNER